MDPTAPKEEYFAVMDGFVSEKRGALAAFSLALSRLPETRRLQGRSVPAEGKYSPEEIAAAFSALHVFFLHHQRDITEELAFYPKEAARFSEALNALPIPRPPLVPKASEPPAAAP